MLPTPVVIQNYITDSGATPNQNGNLYFFLIIFLICKLFS